MSMRATSLQATNVLAINREIDSKYDAVLAVRDKLVEIEKVAGLDVEQLLTDLQNAQDFTGISVVAGETAGWDATTKTITVPTLKGDQGIQGPIGATGATGATGAKGDRGLTGAAGTNGKDGKDGTNGADGIDGIDGIDGKDLTIEQISYDGNTGKFVWQFSDGTSYETPDLRGPKGSTGDKGDKGDTGLGVHHIKGTSTTNSSGVFGVSPFRDTYTVYGDADETINLGYFVVSNGVSDGMSASVYDTDGNGIVDDSERLGGQLPDHYLDVSSNQYAYGNKTFGNNVTIQGDLVVNGNSVTVNSQSVEVEDNLLLINKGEVGNGVTAGEAGILVDRGLATDYKFVWEEAGQAFKIGKIGGLQKVATREDTPINAGIAVWNDAANRFDTMSNITVDSVNGITALSSINPLVASSTAAVGTSTTVARADHVHPVQTSVTGNAGTATTLATGRTIGITGDITYTSPSFDGSANVTATATLTSVGTAGTYTKVTTDSKGRVTSGTTLSVGDIPTLNQNTTGSAGSVVNAEVIKFDTGTTEGTDLYTFNGSTAKTIDIKAGTNVTLTKAAGSITISANDTAVGVTEITGMGTGASAFLATPSSANLAAMLTDETGSGAVVFATSPTLAGTPTAPTAGVGTNTTQIATTAYVVAEINKIEEW